MNTSTNNNDRFHFSYLNIKDFIQFAQGNVGAIWLGKFFPICGYTTQYSTLAIQTQEKGSSMTN
jgi:hypothetical protein